MRFIAILVVLSCLLVFSVLPSFAQEKTEYLEATVIGISEESIIIEPNGNSHPYQQLQMMGTSGSLKGKPFTIENGAQNQINVVKYDVGDKLILAKDEANGSPHITIQDYSRTTPLYVLLAIFVVLTVVIGGKRGAAALLGMALTFVAIFAFILPQISSGQNPVLVTAIAALVIIPITFILSHGPNLKSAAAIISTFVVLALTSILSQVFIELTHLTGFVSEEASFLNAIKEGTLDARGLLFAGIIIALLGVLEDISISQAAIVVQIRKANNKLSMLEVFKRAMDVGRDHIASMTNTLILVYAGASIPLLLLFLDNPMPFAQLINFEIISEEIVRTLTASIGLIIAVPITTLITVLMVRFNHSTKLNLA